MTLNDILYDPYLPTWMTYAYYSIIGLLGLLIGSYLNVVIARVPQGESTVSPGSHCMNCDYVLRWYDNIPVLSWLMLGGKCRSCRTPISARYMVVEILTSISFVLTAFLSRDLQLPAFVMMLGFVAVGIALTAIDMAVYRLPNKLVFALLLIVSFSLGSLLAVTGDTTALVTSLVCGAAAYAVGFVLMVIGGFGFGDVKLIGVTSLMCGWFGWPVAVIAFALAFTLGVVASVVKIVIQKKKDPTSSVRRTGVAFGPYILLGALISVYEHQPIIDWYLSLVGLA